MGKNGLHLDVEKQAIPKNHAFLYWGMAALFYFYEMVLRASTSVFATELAQTFRLHGDSLGHLNAMYYWAYTPLQIPCGLILDKYGPRRILSYSCLVCALGSILFAGTSQWYVLCIARWMIGAGSACAFIGSMKLISQWFSIKHFVWMSGITNLMGCVGGMVAGVPLAKLQALVGWRSSLKILGVLGFLLAPLLYLTIKEKPSYPVKKETVQDFWYNLKSVLSLPTIWIAGLVGGLMYLPISVFAELWAVPFIKNVYPVTAEKASWVPFWIYGGTAVGSALSAYFAACFKSYVTLMKWICAIIALCFVMIVMDIPFSMMMAICALIGIGGGAQVLVFTLSKDYVSPSLQGTASSLTNAVIMTLPLVFQPLLGGILHSSWTNLGGDLSGGAPVYTAAMYRHGMYTFPVCFAISLVLLFFTKDTYKETHERP